MTPSSNHLLKKLFCRSECPNSNSDRDNLQFGPRKLDDAALKRILEKTVKDNPAIWSRKLDDALWAFRTAYKTPTGTTPYKLIYGKNCHLPFEIEHRAYWALKNCNPDLIAAGEKRMFQLHEALNPKWRAKVITIEESKDLTSLSLDELIGNLEVHEMIIKKDSKIVKAKGERKSLALKAKKESTDKESLTSGSEDEEYVLVVRDFKKFFKRRECPKPLKEKNQRAFVEGSWSDSSEEDDETDKNKTRILAQASSEHEEATASYVDLKWSIDDFHSRTFNQYKNTDTSLRNFERIFDRIRTDRASGLNRILDN
ncbi:zf-CCHC domain-containing protein [Tanacetum coccineum]